MKKKSLGINAGLNTLKTLCSIVFPLITFPYVSRVLQVENVGIFHFCSSIVSYFTLLAGLGINAYAIREGARYRDSREEIDRFASEVFSINVFSSLFSCLLLFLSIALVPKFTQYAVILCIMAIMIPLTTIGCEWIFNIYEDFFYITVRTVAFQVLALILLFALVKTERNLLQYTIVSVVSLSGANIVNAISRKKYCSIRFIASRKLIKHIKPILILFANSLAITIYVNSDITLVGFFCGNYSTGLYSVSSKIYLIIKQMLAAIIIVSVPRLSSLIGRGEKGLFQETADKVLNMLLALVMPTIIGLFCISKNVILIISGKNYIGATPSLQILSIALFFCIFSWFYTSCVLVPFREEKKVLLATVVSAVINLLLNCILIPVWKQNAAAATTVLAECASMAICYYFARHYYRPNICKKDIAAISIGCISILVICFIAKHYVSSLILSTIYAIVGSVLSYAFILAIFKHPTFSYCMEEIKGLKMKK